MKYITIVALAVGLSIGLGCSDAPGPTQPTEIPPVTQPPTQPPVTPPSPTLVILDASGKDTSGWIKEVEAEPSVGGKIFRGPAAGVRPCIDPRGSRCPYLLVEYGVSDPKDLLYLVINILFSSKPTWPTPEEADQEYKSWYMLAATGTTEASGSVDDRFPLVFQGQTFTENYPSTANSDLATWRVYRMTIARFQDGQQKTEVGYAAKELNYSF